MAISAAIEWDVQGGVGSDNNGGGYKAGAGGTDYSQVGATPHATLTVLSVVGASTSDIMVSTVDYTIAATDVGNVVQVTGGTATAGFYEIQSITTGATGVQKWTVDRSVGTAAQTVVGAMGGSLATPNKIMSEATALVAGQTIHIKKQVNASDYSRTTAISLGASGSAAAGPIRCLGYTTAHNDITSWAGVANAPLLTTATISVNVITTNGKTMWHFGAMNITSTNATRGNCISASATATISTDLVYMKGLSGVARAAGGLTLQLSRTEIVDGTASGVSNASTVFIADSWIHGNAGSAIFLLTNGVLSMDHTVLDHNTASAVSVASPTSVAITNSVIAMNTGASTDGIQFVTGGVTTNLLMANNILYGNGRYNLNAATVGANNVKFFNAWGGAGTGNTNNDTTGMNAITLTVDPFVNSAANGNFAANTTAGGGALLRALGFPGAFPGGTMTGYVDVGTLQHQDAGSSGMLFIPDLAGT